MARLKIDTETLSLSSIMERISRVRVKDCFKDENNETVYFIVNPGQLGKAIGKGAVNIKKLQNQIGKKIKVIEYKDDIGAFVKNIVYPLKNIEVELSENKVLIKSDNKKTKSLLIGRDGRNLKLLNRALKRFFNIEEVKIV